MKKLFAVFLMIALCLPLFACGQTTGENETTTKKQAETTMSAEEIALQEVAKKVQNQLKSITDTAVDNLLDHFWSDKLGRFSNTFRETGDPGILWGYEMLMLCLETYGDKGVEQYIDDEMKYYYDHYTDEWLLYPGGYNNPCMDDAAWSAMAFMQHYRLTGSEKSLQMAHDMVKASYDHFQDGDTAHGLWYRTPGAPSPYANFKSLYCGGLMLTELEYYAITKGTEQEDLELHQRTLDLYQWIEAHHYRNGISKGTGHTCMNDGLYYCDLYRNDSLGEDIPAGEMGAGTCALFANTAMAVIHKRLYEETGITAYLNKAIALANAIGESEYFNKDGVLWNDRDAWTDCAFMGFFAKEVLTLDGVSDKMLRLMLNTCASIMENCYYEQGYYGSDWEGGTRWVNTTANHEYGNPYYMMNNATTVHILTATLYLVNRGYIPMEMADETLFKDSYNPKPAPDYIDLKNKTVKN